jgi:hypothetical protein
MKRLALVVALSCFVPSVLFAQAAQDQGTQDQDNKKQAAVASKTDKKNQTEEKKGEPKPEKKGGMTADTFSGLKFRLIGLSAPCWPRDSGAAAVASRLCLGHRPPSPPAAEACRLTG